VAYLEYYYSKSREMKKIKWNCYHNSWLMEHNSNHGSQT